MKFRSDLVITLCVHFKCWLFCLCSSHARARCCCVWHIYCRRMEISWRPDIRFNSCAFVKPMAAIHSHAIGPHGPLNSFGLTSVIRSHSANNKYVVYLCSFPLNKHKTWMFNWQRNGNTWLVCAPARPKSKSICKYDFPCELIPSSRDV